MLYAFLTGDYSWLASKRPSVNIFEEAEGWSLLKEAASLQLFMFRGGREFLYDEHEAVHCRTICSRLMP